MQPDPKTSLSLPVDAVQQAIRNALELSRASSFWTPRDHDTAHKVANYILGQLGLEKIDA